MEKSVEQQGGLAAYDISGDQPHSSLLVFGDSLSFYGPEGALPPSHERIWPVQVVRPIKAHP